MILRENNVSINGFNSTTSSLVYGVPQGLGRHNPTGIKLMSQLRLGLSHLREHKFKYNFLDSLDTFYCCGKGEAETSFDHFLLHTKRGLEPPTKFSKRGGLDRTSTFRVGWREREGGDFFQGGYNF